MTSPLDDIIAAATDDGVSTGNLLRKVQVVAHRLKAEKITSWVSRELNGYGSDDELPAYRAERRTPVVGYWTGPFQSSATQAVGSGHAPDEIHKALFTTDIRERVAELEDLAAASEDPSIQWDPTDVVMFNKLIELGRAPGISMMNLFSARQILTRAGLRGVLDSIRTTALDFALELQSTSPDAGSLNGPTVADKPIAQTVFNVTNNIYGHGANVAQGESMRQRSNVVTGDLAGLLAAAEKLGLSASGVAELEKAVTAPADKRQSRVAAFVQSVRTGGLVLSAGVASDLAADQIAELIRRFLGG